MPKEKDRFLSSAFQDGLSVHLVEETGIWSLQPRDLEHRRSSKVNSSNWLSLEKRQAERR